MRGKKMKEKKLYTCEHCNTDYSDKAMALKCEKNHKTKCTIVNSRFLPITNCEDGFPITITLEYKGKTVTYKR